MGKDLGYLGPSVQNTELRSGGTTVTRPEKMVTTCGIHVKFIIERKMIELVSSANTIFDSLSETLERLLLYSKNNRGPRLDP